MATHDEQIEAYMKEAFEINDVDGNGSVTPEESMRIDAAVYKHRGKEYDDEAKAKTMAEFTELDSIDKVLGRSETAACMLTHARQDGKITLEEWIKASKKMFADIEPEQLIEILPQIIAQMREATAHEE